MRRYSCVLLMVCVFAAGGSSTAKQGGGDADPQFGQRRGESQIEEKFERQVAKRWQKHQYESLKKDTDRLLEISTELKQYVDKANENVLSLEVVKKAEEVEKLAKKVKEKMKESRSPADKSPAFRR